MERAMEREVSAALQELSDGWVEFELQGADFGDERLNRRYTKVLGKMSKMPQSAFNQSAEDLSEMLGAYRFISNKKVTAEKLLAPHHEQLVQRAEGEQTVLLIQDTTFMDMSDHLKCTDLKPLKITLSQKALWVHTTLAVLPNGLPLGVLDAQFMSGKVAEQSTDHPGSQRPIADKRSQRWLQAADNCRGILGDNIRKIWVCDREADIYELFDHLASHDEQYVVRARFERATEDGPFYDTRQAIERQTVQGEFKLTIAATGRRAARTATMALKYIPATLSAPEYKHAAVTAKAVPGYLVEALEIDPPEGKDPLCWQLLTNLPVESFADALEVIEIYKKRWAIEELFKILKSGCRAEKAQFQTTERLGKYITLSLIVAWRIYYLVHVNRLQPDAPADTVLTSAELETLQLLLDDKRKRKKKQRRIIIRTASQAITEIAKLGGYLDRKNDPHPGIVVLWKGTMALAFSTMTYLAHKRATSG